MAEGSQVSKVIFCVEILWHWLTIDTDVRNISHPGNKQGSWRKPCGGAHRRECHSHRTDGTGGSYWKIKISDAATWKVFLIKKGLRVFRQESFGSVSDSFKVTLDSASSVICRLVQIDSKPPVENCLFNVVVFAHQLKCQLYYKGWINTRTSAQI